MHTYPHARSNCACSKINLFRPSLVAAGMEEEAVFGISLGSFSASIALSKGPKTELLANHAGERTTPTLVSYRDGEEVIGRAAKQSLHRNASNTASHMFHLVGRSFDNEYVGKIASAVTGKVVRGEDGRVCYLVMEREREKQVPVSDSLTLILKSLHETAESFTGSDSEMAAVVVAVPPDFTVPQRNIIRSCCEEAGFEVMRIITESSAVCLAHGIGQRNKTEKSYVVVYNLGAHSLSLSLLLVAGGMFCELATRTVSEDVGGTEFDKIIADFLSTEFEKQWKVSVRGNEKCRFKLLAAAESAKHALSRVQTTAIHLESLHDGLDLNYSLSRGRFEGLCTGVFRRCVDSGVISDLLCEGGVTRSDVDQVIMAGGSCNIPLLHSLVEAEFPGCEILVSSPDEVVATGCALQAGLMRERWEGREEEEGEGVEIPCSPYDLWIKGEQRTDHLLLPSLSPLPCHTSLSLSLPLEGNDSPHYSLELWERRSSNDETQIAKVLVPVGGASCESGEDVSVRVTLIWTVENAITMTTTRRDSDWSLTLNLSCCV